MARSFRGKIPRVPIGADTTEADKQIDKLYDRIKGLKHITIDADVNQAQRRLATIVKRTNSQMSSDLVNMMIKDFKVVLGAMKTEFENVGVTDIYKSLEHTCDMVEDRFSNLKISIDKKQVSGLVEILNAVGEMQSISDFSFGELVSSNTVKNAEKVLENIKEAKDEITSIAKKAEYIVKTLDKSADKTFSVKKLQDYQNKLHELRGSLKGFYNIDDDLIQNALVSATSKINNALSQIDIQMPKVKVSDDTIPTEEVVKDVALMEKSAKAVEEVASRISKNSNISAIKGMTELSQEAVNVTRVLSKMYKDGITDTERYITLQYRLKKVFDAMGKSYGGVRKSGAKNGSELLDLVIDGIQQRTGVNLFSDTDASGVMENLFGDSDFSLFNKSLYKFGMKHIAELLLSWGKTGDWVDMQKQVTKEVEKTVEAVKKEVSVVKEAKQEQKELEKSYESTNDIMNKSRDKHLGKDWKHEIFSVKDSKEAAQVLSEINAQAKLLEEDALKAKSAYDGLMIAISSYRGIGLSNKSDFQKAIKDAWFQGEKEAAAKLFESYQSRFPDGKFNPNKQFGTEWTENFDKNLANANRNLTIWRGQIKAAAEEYGKFLAYQELTKEYNPATGIMGFGHMAQSRLSELQKEEEAAMTAAEKSTKLIKEAQSRFATDDLVTAQNNLNAAIDEYNSKLAESNRLLAESQRLQELESFENEPWFNSYDTPATKIMEVARQAGAADDAVKDYVVSLKEAVRVYRELGGDMKLPFSDEGLLKEIDIPVKVVPVIEKSKYYEIDENAARMSKQMRSFDDYKEGSATASYKAAVDELAAIAELKKLKDNEGLQEENDIYKLWTDKKDMRIRISFEMGKPDQEIIDMLRSKSFKWSPKNEVWQRQLTDNAIYATKQLQKAFHEFYQIETQPKVDTAAQEKMANTAKLIGKLQEKYGTDQFKNIFGGEMDSFGALDTSNAVAMYDALIAKEKEYLEVSQSRINTLNEFVQSNNELLGQFANTDNYNDVEAKFSALSASILEGNVGLEEANKQLQEFVGTLSEAVAKQKDLFKAPKNNYEKLFNTLTLGDNAFESKSKGVVSGFSWADRETIAEALVNGLQQGLDEINLTLNNGNTTITFAGGIESAANILDKLGFKAVESEITKFIGKVFKKAETVIYDNAGLGNYVTDGLQMYRLSRPLNEQETEYFKEFSPKDFTNILKITERATESLPTDVREAVLPPVGKQKKGDKVYIFKTEDGQYLTVKKSLFDNVRTVSSAMKYDPVSFRNKEYNGMITGFGEDGSVVSGVMPMHIEDVESMFNSGMSALKDITGINNKILDIAGVKQIEDKIANVTPKIEEQVNQIKKVVQLVDNYGQELDEVNNKLMQGSNLLNEQGQILRLFHNSSAVFDKFDTSKSGNRQGVPALGKGNYLALKQDSKYNDARFGRYQTQWYANVNKVFDAENDTLSTEQINDIIDKFLPGLSDGDKKNYINKFVKKYMAHAVKYVAQQANVEVADIWQRLGYNAVQLGDQINIFDSSKIHRANDIVTDVGVNKQKLPVQKNNIVQENKQLTSSYEGLAEAVEKFHAVNQKVWSAYKNNSPDYQQLKQQREQAIAEIQNLFPTGYTRDDMHTKLLSSGLKDANAEDILGLVEKNLANANKKEAHYKLYNLVNKYSEDERKAVFGEVPLLDKNLDNAQQVYDALVAKEQEYLEAIKQREAAATQEKTKQTQATQEAEAATVAQVEAEKQLAEEASKVSKEKEKQKNKTKKATNTSNNIITGDDEDVKETILNLANNTQSMIDLISSAAGKSAATKFLEGVTGESDLRERIANYFNEVFNSSDWKFKDGKGALSIKGDTLTANLVNSSEDALQAVFKLDEGVLKLQDDLLKLSVANNVDIFDAKSAQDLALSSLAKLQADAERAKYDLSELDQQAKAISSSDDVTKFNAALKNAQNNIQAIKNSTATKGSMNPLINMQRDMQNAGIEIETMRLKLEKFGDIQGVNEAKKMLEEMTSVAKQYNEATDAQGQQSAYNQYSNLRSSFKAQTEYINAAKALNDSQKTEEKKTDPIREQYQSILDLINKINVKSTEITKYQAKDGGSGLFANYIQQLQSEKAKLVSELKGITDEINNTLGSGFVQGKEFSVPFASFLDDSGAISSFLNDTKTQASLTTEEIEKLIVALQKSQNIDAQAATKVAEQFKSVQETYKRLSDLTGLDKGNENYQALVGVFGQIMKYKESLSSDPTSWTPEESARLQTLIDQFTKYGNALADVGEKEARYFAGKQKYTQGTTFGNATQSVSDETKKLNETRKQLEDAAKSFAKDSGVGDAFITGFTQSADGMSKLDFSIFDAATGSLRNFRMEMGSVTEGMYVTETTISKSLANIQAAQKQLQSVSSLIGRLDASGVNVGEGNAPAQVAKLLEMYKQLSAEISKGDGADQNKITKLTKDLRLASTETEKFYKQMLQMESAIASGQAKNLGVGDPKGDVYGQLVNKAKELAGTQQNATLEFGRFDKATNTLNASLVHANGTVENFQVQMNGLSGQMIAQQSGVTKLTTSWDRFKASIGRAGKQLMTAFVGYNVFYKAISEVRKGIGYVKEIDLALTELKKVTDETEESYRNFLNTAAGTAGEIGSTVSDFTEASANFARLGYTMEESAEMAKTAIVYKNVADGLDTVEESTDSIISTMKAFGIESDDTMGIVDRFNEVGVVFADIKVA